MATRVASPKSYVYIFSRALSFFKETELRSILKDLFHLILLNPMFKGRLSMTFLNQIIPLILIDTALQYQEIRQQLFPFSRHNRFRMKLHAFDFHLAVTQAHDDAVRSARGNFQT